MLVCALLLSGCGLTSPDQEESSTAPVQTEPRERTLNQTAEPAKGFGLAYVPDYGFNPYACTCITNRPVFSLVYEPLFVLGNTFQPEPVLCQQFAVSEDGKRCLITLCEGVRFSDGTPLTAADAAASLEAAQNSDYYGSRFSKVEAFTARDEHTLEITLFSAYENLPLLLDVPIVKGGTQTAERPLGTGPYVFSEEDGLCLRRNRGWWQDNRAPVEYDRIMLTACKDPAAVRDSFEFGTTSLVCADLNAPNAVGYRCDYELWDNPTTTMQYLGFNLTNSVFYQRELRAAVTHIINREALIASVYKGFAEAAYLPCAPASPLYDQELAQSYAYDEEAFAKSLRSAEIAEGYVATLIVCSADPARVELAHRVADAISNAGLKTEVKPLDMDTYRYRLNAGQYDMFIGETRLSGNFDLTEFFKPYGSLGVGGIRSAGMEQLCYETLENSGNCYDLYRGVMENGYFCPLLFKSYAVMANRGVIGALHPAVDCVFHLAGGRSLADASVSYAEMAGTEEENTESTEMPGEAQTSDNTEEKES